MDNFRRVASVGLFLLSALLSGILWGIHSNVSVDEIGIASVPWYVRQSGAVHIGLIAGFLVIAIAVWPTIKNRGEFYRFLVSAASVYAATMYIGLLFTIRGIVHHELAGGPRPWWGEAPEAVMLTAVFVLLGLSVFVALCINGPKQENFEEDAPALRIAR